MAVSNFTRMDKEVKKGGKRYRNFKSHMKQITI